MNPSPFLDGAFQQWNGWAASPANHQDGGEFAAVGAPFAAAAAATQHTLTPPPPATANSNTISRLRAVDDSPTRLGSSADPLYTIAGTESAAAGKKKSSPDRSTSTATTAASAADASDLAAESRHADGSGEPRLSSPAQAYTPAAAPTRALSLNAAPFVPHQMPSSSSSTHLHQPGTTTLFAAPPPVTSSAPPPSVPTTRSSGGPANTAPPDHPVHNPELAARADEELFYCVHRIFNLMQSSTEGAHSASSARLTCQVMAEAAGSFELLFTRTGGGFRHRLTYEQFHNWVHSRCGYRPVVFARTSPLLAKLVPAVAANELRLYPESDGHKSLSDDEFAAVVADADARLLIPAVEECRHRLHRFMFAYAVRMEAAGTPMRVQHSPSMFHGRHVSRLIQDFLNADGITSAASVVSRKALEVLANEIISRYFWAAPTHASTSYGGGY